MNVNDSNDLRFQAELIERIEVLVKALDANYSDQWPDNEPTTFALDRSFNGKRFYRIVSQRLGRTQSVHAFVDKDNGDLLKAGSFKAPQKGKYGLAVRGNLLDDDDFARILRECDWTGRYLYAR